MTVAFKTRKVEGAMRFLDREEVNSIVCVVSEVMEVWVFVTEPVDVPSHDFNIVMFGTLFATSSLWVSEAREVSGIP